LSDATIDEADERDARCETPSCFALIVAWSRDEPWRIGEALLLPRAERLHFGRGAQLGPFKTELARCRPNGVSRVEPLGTSAISRQQLEFRVRDAERCRVQNVGRCPLLHNGLEVSEAVLGNGDLLQLGRQLLFVCRARFEVASSAPSAHPSFPFGWADAHGLVGESPSMWRLRRQIAFAAARHGHVLVHGASGVGKELVARALHESSSRKAALLVSRSAATLPEALIDAELFGNARNYPNPGMAERPGLIGAADGSSLFLDEIGELPQSAQAHLLRALDNGEYQRLGESHTRLSSFRLLAATNRSPEELKHDFRARFALRIEVPALSQRPEDIPLLIRHALRRAALRHDELALGMFPDRDPSHEPVLPLPWVRDWMSGKYPGNIRELESNLWRAIESAEVGPAPARETASERPGPVQPETLTPQRIQTVLDQHFGIVDHAFRALGLSSRFVLLRLIKKHGLTLNRTGARGAQGLK
jgi:two-component system nitrogen regulation response regulator GlnG/two-component system response regulator HydG